MRTSIRLPGRTRLLSPITAAAMVAALLAPLGAAAPVAASPARPAAAPAATTSAPQGPVTGTNCSPGCDLYATASTFSLPGGGTAPIWGYSLTSTPGSASLPGPVLVVNQGDPVAITLHNVDVPSATSLMIAGQPGTPDQAGVTSGNSKTYTFTAGTLLPGTYLYEAGLTADGPRQAAMGLSGALIVRPTGAPLQAYANPATTFADEAVLVLSELDPAFNADPLAYDMTAFAPKYWLINGKGYPGTAEIATAAGNNVLLRYVNAGLVHHSMGLLGLHQAIVATDAQPASNPSTVVAQTVAAGGTLDTIVTMPAAPAGTRYPLYEAAMHLDNTGASTSGVINFGGMLTFLTTGTGVATNTGPVTSGAAVSPSPTNGTVAVSLSASASDVTTGGDNVTAAEYFIDSIGANGTGTATGGVFGAPTASISATISVGQLAALASGNHTVYVHAQDSSGAWGSFDTAVLNLDKTGPSISNLTATPSLDNGSANVALVATASDVATGNQNVIAAEYFIDSQPAATVRGTALAANNVAPAVSLSGTIPAATVALLSEGAHVIDVRAEDASGTWGAFGTVSLTVDKSAPTASAVSVVPNPNNGTLGVQISSGGAFYVRVDATFSDPLSGGVNSNVAAAEYFFDTVGANGSGGAMIPTDGAYNSPTESAYGAVDLINIATLSAGNHTIYVHARDAAGNWGPTSTTTLTIDKAGPTTSGVTLTPPASNNTAVTVSAAATDVATGNSNIAGGEAFVDAVGANGAGSPMTAAAAAPATTISGSLPAVVVAALNPGNHTIYVHARDAAGNWGPVASGTLLIDRTAPTFASITLGPPASIAAGTATVNLTVNGAADPLVSGLASGVAGGEWWFGTTNPANGGGTAFSGLTTSISTACLAPGTYTVRARIRDAAGNWSTGASGVRSATLTVTGPAAAGIFCDSFEAPNVLPGNWTSRSTTTAFRLSVTAAAAMAGAWGLQAQGNNTNYLQYNFGTAANPTAAAYDARFYFRPNGNTSAGKDILAAATTNNFTTQLFHVRYRLSGGLTQVQIQVGATANGTWTNVSSTTANVIEVVWQSSTSLQLYVNGALSQTLTPGAGSVGAVRLGSVTNTGNATLMYFDAFASKRTASPLIGP